MNAFARRLERSIRRGNLKVIDASGREAVCGDGTGPEVVVRLHDRHLPWKIALNASLAVSEAYIDGRLTMERGSLRDCFRIGFDLSDAPAPAPFSWFHALGRILGLGKGWSNLLSLAPRNVRSHYDVDPRIYDLFLDKDKHYSCAYFSSPDLTLEEAQLAKARLIAAKLHLEPGMRVLDIGSGWGAMAFHLAEEAGVHVTGITLSENQHAWSCKRAIERGLGDRTAFHIADYRKFEGQFDRILSVGMFEHVGVHFYPAFFAAAARLLKREGVMLLHTIGRLGPPAPTDPFTRKYIFPGGCIPALSEIAPVLEKAGFFLADVEALRMHYAETLCCWRDRFHAHYARAAEIAGERFCRMWECYLAGSEAGFRVGQLGVFQLQLAREAHALPITRDYMMARPGQAAAGRLKVSAPAAQ